MSREEIEKKLNDLKRYGTASCVIEHESLLIVMLHGKEFTWGIFNREQNIYIITIGRNSVLARLEHIEEINAATAYIKIVLK